MMLDCPANLMIFYLGKEAMKSKGESAEGGLPSKAELKKTIIGILKKVDFNTVGYTLIDHASRVPAGSLT